VRHEEVRVEREPITAANRGDALEGPDRRHRSGLPRRRNGPPGTQTPRTPPWALAVARLVTTASGTDAERLRLCRVEPTRLVHCLGWLDRFCSWLLHGPTAAWSYSAESAEPALDVFAT